MIEEVSSIFWGLSLAINIVLLLLGLPLCLLIFCCCRKHQGALERDVASFIQNHNLAGSQNQPPQLTYQMQPGMQGMQPNQGMQNQEVQQKVHGSQANLLSSQDPVQNEKPEIRKRTYPQLNQSFSLDDNELIE